MHNQRLITTLLLSFLVAAPAAAFDVKPGEWEMETAGRMAGMELPKQKIKFCITPEQAKNRGEEMLKNNAVKDCKMKPFDVKGDSVSYEMSCNHEGMKMETKGTTKKVSENETVTNSTSTFDMNGQKHTQQMTVTQKYVGATCSSEAIQAGMQGGKKQAPGK